MDIKLHEISIRDLIDGCVDNAREATIRKNQMVDDRATFKESLTVDDDIVNQDAEIEND